MNKDIYKLAIECKEFDEHEIKITKSIFPYNNYILSDYTIQGDIKTMNKSYYV